MRSFIITCILIMIVSLPSLSQEQRRRDLYFGGGLSIPLYPQYFNDNWLVGFQLGGGIGIPLSPDLALVISAEYNRFALDDENFLKSRGYVYTGQSSNGGSTSIVTVFGSAKYSFSATSTEIPYILIGAGYFYTATSEITSTYRVWSKGSESTLGFQVGLGIDIPINEKDCFFIDGRYVIGMTSGSSTAFLPLRAGIKLQL